MTSGISITGSPSQAWADTVVYEKDKAGDREVRVVREGRRGVVGEVFHAVGYILALPFRIIAGLIEAIF